MYENVMHQANSVRTKISEIVDEISTISIFVRSLGFLGKNFEEGNVGIDMMSIFNDIHNKIDSVGDKLDSQRLELGEVVGGLDSMVINSIKEGDFTRQ